LYLPGIPKDQIKLNKSGDELNIRIGNHRRNLVLPQAISRVATLGRENGRRLSKNSLWGSRKSLNSGDR